MEILFTIFAAFCIVGSVSASDAICQSTFLVGSEVDFGFYVASSNGSSVTFTKSCIGGVTPLFSPGVCTEIIIHGLQPGNVALRRQIIDSVAIQQIMQKATKNLCNIVFFLYTQFADEQITNAERVMNRIWDPRSVAGMEYTYMDPTGNIRVAEYRNDKSIADLFVDLYAAHMTLPLSAPDEIRLIGHSLGCHVAVLASHKILKNNNIPVKPHQIVLLDPVIINGNREFLVREPCGPSVGDVIVCMIETLLRAGIPTSYFRSSDINVCIGSQHKHIIFVTAFSHVKLLSAGDRGIGRCYYEDIMAEPTDANSIGSQVYTQHVDIVEWWLNGLVETKAARRCNYYPKTDTCDPMDSIALGPHMKSTDVIKWVSRGMRDSTACFVQYDDKKRLKDSSTMNTSPSDDLFYLVECNSVHM